MPARFAQYGKTYQLDITGPEDLKHVLELNEAHWVATSVPSSALRCDRGFLDYVDSDSNGRIRTDEIRESVQWLLEVLADIGTVMDGTDEVSLCAIDAGCEKGAGLISSAKHVLASAGTPGSDSISLAQVRDFLANVKEQPLNGDGIIVPDASPDTEVAQFINDVLSCYEGAVDASGKKGITEKQLDEFRKGAGEFLSWRAHGKVEEEGGVTDIMPLGSETPALYEVYARHASAIDNFFAVSMATLFDESSEDRFVGPEKKPDGEDTSAGMAAVTEHLESLPIARPTPDLRLALDDTTVNPLYRTWICELRERVLERVLGRKPEILVEQDWNTVKDRFAPYAAYLGEKRGAAAEKLPAEKLQRHLDGPCIDKTRVLIEKDREIADVLEGVHQVERLLLYHANIGRLLNNFVNFSELYDLSKRALFETGSAVMDGRWFNMAVKVDDRAAHASIAKASNIFIIYMEISAGEQNKFCVAVPATAGKRGNVTVGKRGIFFDIDGKQYDARVVQVIENPISVGEALGAPLRRLWSFMVGKIEALSGSSEKELLKKADTATGMPAAPASQAGPGNMLMGISVSFAALGTSFAFISKTLTSMSLGARLASLGGALLVVFVPVSFLALIKLRSQDLAALLEGCGWGINAQLRLNNRLRRQFTLRAPYPDDAEGTPRKHWIKILVVGVVLIVSVLAGRAVMTAWAESMFRRAYGTGSELREMTKTPGHIAEPVPSAPAAGAVE